MAVDSGFRDVPISSFSFDEWNTLEVPPAEDYDVNMHEEEFDELQGGGGYQYLHLDHRFIIWRIQGNEIELVETSTKDSLHESNLRLSFSQSLLPNLCIVEDENDSAIYLFAVTIHNRLYRLSFPHPSSMDRRVSFYFLIDHQYSKSDLLIFILFFFFFFFSQDIFYQFLQIEVDYLKKIILLLLKKLLLYQKYNVFNILIVIVLH